MPLDGLTKLLDASKAVSKMIHIKISKKEAYKLWNSWTDMEDMPAGACRGK